MISVELNRINPHIRFAQQMNYSSPGAQVYVRDCRIFYITGGCAQIETDGKRYDLNKDSLFFCREKSIYKISAGKAVIISLNFDMTQRNCSQTKEFALVPTDSNIADGNKKGNINIEKGFINSHIFIENACEYLPMLEEILSEFKLQRIYFREKASSLLKNMLTDMARENALPTHHSSKAVSAAVEYINKNFAKQITNEQIAEPIGYHKHHLNRLFIEYTGQSLHKYLLMRRLTEAKKLLLGSDLCLYEIALRCGFCSNTHFSSYFKQSTGMTPHEYRSVYSKNI